MRRQIPAADPPVEPRGASAPEAGRTGLDAVASGLPIFDADRTLSLCGHDPDIVREIVTLFLSSSAELLTALDEAVSIEDPKAVYAAAHTLKGAASNLGADRIQAAARRLMEMADRGRLDGCDRALAEVSRSHDELVESLEAFLDAHRMEDPCAS